MTKRRLGELLQAEGLITDDQLRAGLEEQRRSNMFLGEALVKLAFVSEEAIAQTIVQQFNLPFLSAAQYNISVDVLTLFPERMYFEYQFIAMDKIGKVLVIVGAGLMNHDVLDELERLSGCKVCQFVSTWKDIRNALDKYAKDLRKETEVLTNLGSMLLEGGASGEMPIPKLPPPPVAALAPAAAAATTAPKPALAPSFMQPQAAPAAHKSSGALKLSPPKVTTMLSNAVSMMASAPSGTAVIPVGAAGLPIPGVAVAATAQPPAQAGNLPRLSALTGVRPPGGTQQIKVPPPPPSALVGKEGEAAKPAPAKTGLLGLFKKS